MKRGLEPSIGMIVALLVSEIFWLLCGAFWIKCTLRVFTWESRYWFIALLTFLVVIMSDILGVLSFYAVIRCWKALRDKRD